MFSKYQTRPCARCTKLHICTGTPICPCFEIAIPDKVLDFIASDFDGCICNDCLEALKTKMSSK